MREPNKNDMRRVDALIRSCSHEDYADESYVPIDAYRWLQHDLAETEQHLIEAVNEVEALAPYKREAKVWRFFLAAICVIAILFKWAGY